MLTHSTLQQEHRATQACDCQAMDAALSLLLFGATFENFCKY